MPRLPRFDVPGMAQHIVQRGNDRLPCFAAELDYIRYLQDLRDVARENGVAIHAHQIKDIHGRPLGDKGFGVSSLLF